MAETLIYLPLIISIHTRHSSASGFSFSFLFVFFGCHHFSPSTSNVETRGKVLWEFKIEASHSSQSDARCDIDTTATTFRSIRPRVEERRDGKIVTHLVRRQIGALWRHINFLWLTFFKSTPTSFSTKPREELEDITNRKIAFSLESEPRSFGCLHGVSL